MIDQELYCPVCQAWQEFVAGQCWECRVIFEPEAMSGIIKDSEIKRGITEKDEGRKET